MAFDEKNSNKTISSNRETAYLIGIILIASGAVILLDQSLKTGWLTLIVLPAIGLTFMVGGIRSQRLGYIIPGGLITGLGIGVFLFFASFVDLGWFGKIGLLLTAFGLGWCSIALVTYLLSRRITWWALVTGAVIAPTGLTFLLSPLRITDFALYIGAGLGLVLLGWGMHEHLFGLMIPGCLLLGLGPGVYAAWSGTVEPNSLARTGIMLVGFALGWGLITVLSRVVLLKFVWWPLIPGGIMAMVGWGLYIGGNPGNALNFISNTGSIGLIFFGIYLLLLRRGIHR